MFLESPDVHQIINCGIGQGYHLHRIQVYIVLIPVHHENSVSKTIMNQAVNIILPVFLLVLLQP